MQLDIQVPATYPSGCKIVFCGESPGEEEVKQRQGFVGAAGKCLQKACSVAGLEFSGIGRSNVAKRRPPNNKFRECFYETIEEPIYTKTGKLSKNTKKVESKTKELQEWEINLRDEFKRENPNLIVACGNEALETITGLKGITDYRGSIIADKWGDNHKVLTVEHPSFIIRGNPERFWILAHDLKKAKREAEFPDIIRESWAEISNPEHCLVPILNAFNWIGYHPGAKWTLDVETRAGTLACFAIAFDDEGIRAVCVPIQTTSGSYWTIEEEFKIWKSLKATANANSNLCNQNIEYDIDYLLRYGIEPSGVYQDTMLAHSILYPEFPKGLDFLCSFYLDDVVYYKGKSTKTDIETWTRASEDAVYTLRIVEKIDEELKRRGMWEMYHGRNQI